MKHSLRLLLLCLFTIIFTIAHAQEGVSLCDGTLLSRLSVGSLGRIPINTTVNLRSNGTTNASIIQELASGTEFEIIGGPSCGAYVWWQIQLADGTVGWAAEGFRDDYFLEPLSIIDGSTTSDSGNQHEDLASAIVGTWVSLDQLPPEATERTLTFTANGLVTYSAGMSYREGVYRLVGPNQVEFDVNWWVEAHDLGRRVYVVEVELSGNTLVLTDEDGNTNEFHREGEATIGSQEIGHLRWTLTDNQTGQILGSGDSAVTPEDILVVERIDDETGEIDYNKSIQLAEGFAVGIFIANVEDIHDNGFGFSLRNSELETFSWDWFSFESESVATKLQGAGQVAFRFSTQGSRREIGYTEFLTDVVLRSYEPPDYNANGLPPRWTATIYAGSYVDWSKATLSPENDLVGIWANEDEFGWVSNIGFYPDGTVVLVPAEGDTRGTYSFNSATQLQLDLVTRYGDEMAFTRTVDFSLLGDTLTLQFDFGGTFHRIRRINESDIHACPNSVDSRILVGFGGQVSRDTNSTVSLRAEPSMQATTVDDIPPGRRFLVIGGPECNEELAWWQVRIKDAGTVGWMAEGDTGNYFIDPFPYSEIILEDPSEEVVVRTAPFDFAAQPNMVDCNYVATVGTGQARAESDIATGNLLLDLKARSLSGSAEGRSAVGIRYAAPYDGVITIEAIVEVAGFDSLINLEAPELGETGIASIESSVELYVRRLHPARDDQQNTYFARRLTAPEGSPIPGDPTDIVQYSPSEVFNGTAEITVVAGDELFVCAGIRSKVVATGLLPLLVTAKALYGPTAEAVTRVESIRIAYQ